ncbi:hypothetical protein [Humisphaera borealis]|uniref:Uncharacterized protein n=1 Tax=Humisphaera borealis TaxID=2807512 RepID=A0A7M2WYW9_9BACT|nr:hypothetical protein [Humisphaera borealis]QOV90629.1 hypothetical protein IPV69_04505 [Humisphaera borealis]
MTFRPLALQLALATCALIALNIGVARLARKSVPRQLLDRSERSKPATDLFLGNSTMAAGLDEMAFAAAQPGSRPLNLGLGATKPIEHYLIYRQQDRHRGGALYYGFLDTQLTDPPDSGWSFLFGNRAMGYYVETETAAEFYFPNDPTRQAAFRAVAQIPVLVERSAIWAKVELVRRSLGEIGLPKKESNLFGRVEDFSLLEADRGVFALHCARATEARAPLAPSVAALLAMARDRSAPVWVIEMPVTEQHRRRLYNTPAWAAYRAHIVELVSAAGGRYVQAADWIGDDGFADHLHLNAAGAAAFSARLAIDTRERR